MFIYLLNIKEKLKIFLPKIIIIKEQKNNRKINIFLYGSKQIHLLLDH